MKEILKLTLSLTFICAVAGGALAFVAQKTALPREQARIAKRNAKMTLLLPETTARVEEAFIDGEVTFFGAHDASGNLVAYCAESSDPNGFGGVVKVLVGFNPDGVIRGVLVLENSETPGIGSRACNREKTKSLWGLFQKHEEAATDRELPPNSYLDSYSGKSLGEEFRFGGQSASNVVTPVSGATVSSSAIRNAVNKVSIAARNRIHFERQAEKDKE